METLVGTYSGIDNQRHGCTLIGNYNWSWSYGATDGTENTFIGHQVGFNITGWR